MLASSAMHAMALRGLHHARSLLLVGHTVDRCPAAACARPDEDGQSSVNSKPWTVNCGGVDRPEPRGTRACIHDSCAHCRTQWFYRVPRALGKAQFIFVKALPSAVFGEDHSKKNRPVKASLSSVFRRVLDKGFVECPTLDKVGTGKNPKEMGIFLIGGGPHRPAPVHLRHFFA